MQLSSHGADKRNASLSLQKGPGDLSNRALKRIYAASSRLTANVDRAQIREMIRRGFFSKGIWLDELDTIESVAKDILKSRDNRGRTMLEIDPQFWTNAKEIVDLGAKRRPPAQIRKTALLETIANQAELAVGMDFERGNVQFLNDTKILHSREAYEDDEDPTRRRHLLRLLLR